MLLQQRKTGKRKPFYLKKTKNSYRIKMREKRKENICTKTIHHNANNNDSILVLVLVVAQHH